MSDLLEHMAALGREVRKVSAAGEGFANPYHGTERFGGRPEWSHTWFHGTRANPPIGLYGPRSRAYSAPDLQQGRPAEENRGAGTGQGWPQPNKMLGTHFTPLHRVAHRFAKGVYPSKPNPERGYKGSPGVPSALVHAKLHFRDPAHYPSEKHLNIAIAGWAQEHHPQWHDQQLNDHMAWNHSDREGTHRDFAHPPAYKTGGSYEENQDFHRLASTAQNLLQWHPHLPEILHDFTDHLIRSGHHGITYGNEVEGPGQGGHEGAHDKEFADHTDQDVRHISAIATRPSQIESTHVEHIAPPKTEPEAHEVESSPTEPRFWGEDETWEHGKHGYSSDLNEDKPMYDRVGKFHAERGGELPREPRQAQAVKAPPLAAGTDLTQQARLPLASGRRGSQPTTALVAHFTPPPDLARHMAAAETWYHGTSYELKPGHELHASQLAEHGSGLDRMFMIRSQKAASHFARSHAIYRYDEGHHEARPHVYEVEPIGDVREEETGHSAPGLRVKREVEFTPPYKYAYPGPWEKQACLTCGCDEPHNRHGDDANITIEDLEDAADWADVSTDQAVKNLQHTVKHEKGKTAAVADPRDRVVRMHPRDLMQYVERYRTEDEGGMRHRQELAQKFRQKGYQPRLHGGMSGDTHSYPPSSPITLVHQDDSSFFLEGNHRVHALNDIGYDKKVPVLVKDRRTSGKTAAADPHGYGADSPDYVHCGKGHEHWGRYGSADLLYRFSHPADGHYRYLLHKRDGVDHKHDHDTWDLPGGGRKSDREKHRQAAEREFREEAGPMPRGGKRKGTFTEDCGQGDGPVPYVYKCFTVEVPEIFLPDGSAAELPEETAGLAWFSRDEIAALAAGDLLERHLLRNWKKIFPEEKHRKTGLSFTAIIDPERLLPEHRHAFEVEDHRAYRREMLEVAKARKPGTVVWRGERRDKDLDPHKVTDVGMHWSANPDSIIHGTNTPGKRVHVWQGEIEHPDQAFQRGHAIWHGRHESYDHEAEVRFKPGAKVKLHGVYTWHGDDSDDYDRPGMGPVPTHPERNDPGWKWTPLSHHVKIRHTGEGASDYTHLGIPAGSSHYEEPPKPEHTAEDLRAMSGEEFDAWVKKKYPHIKEAQGRRFYHGSPHRFEPGDYVETPEARGERSRNLSEDDWDADPEYEHYSQHNNFFSTDKHEASFFANLWGRGHVYEVEPLGEVHKDERDNNPTAFRSPHPLRVIRRMDMRRKVGARDLSGISFRYIKPGTLTRGGYPHIHTLVAHHPDIPGYPDKNIYPEGKFDHEAGHMQWREEDGKITGAYVHPGFRRRGIATELFSRAQQITPHLAHSETLSPDAESWISSLGKEAKLGAVSEGYTTCDQGHEHWGRNGAAGLLIRHRDPDDGRVRYLLQHRSPHVDHPGTWSTPGGALRKGEDPVIGAVRETEEEWGHDMPPLRHSHTVTDDHGGWAYHTVVMESPERFAPPRRNWESGGHGWYTPEELPGLNLHPGFADSWARVRSSMGRSAVFRRTAVGGYDINTRSAMISLDLPEDAASKIAVPGGTQDHHVTVVYLGPDVDDEAYSEACRRAREAAAGIPGPLEAILRGIDSFEPSESSGWRRPAYVPVILPARGHALRRELADLSASEHQRWVPHVSLAYLEDGEPMPPPARPVSVSFPALSVHRGEHEVARFPFG